jgi:hypothetical protein
MCYSTKLKAYFILDELDEYEGVEGETFDFVGFSTVGNLRTRNMGGNPYQ